jgi:hypothetical protein
MPIDSARYASESTLTPPTAATIRVSVGLSASSWPASAATLPITAPNTANAATSPAAHCAATAMLHRDQILSRWEVSAREGVRILGANTPAGTRMAEMLAFLQFVKQELPMLLERWRASRADATPSPLNSG